MIQRYELTLGTRASAAELQDILNYIGLLRTQDLHPKSLRNHLFAIKVYYQYLVLSGVREDHPCQHLNLKDQINRQIHLENLYKKEELEAFYQGYQSPNPTHKNRDKSIISLLIYQGLSISEITTLKVTDLNLEEGSIRILPNAQNKGRILSLKPTQILLFHSYLETGSQTNYFILNEDGNPLKKDKVNRIINRGRAKENRLRPLKIRQSVIANLLKENHDIRIVQEFAGHRKTASTEAYRQTGLEELKASIDRLHPLQ